MTPETLSSIGAALGLQTKAYVAEAMAKAVAESSRVVVALQARVDLLEARLASVKDGEPGRPGVDGKDAPPVDLDVVAVKAAALIPVPKNGENAPAVNLDDLALKAAELIHVPKDGKDAPPVDLDALAIKADSLIPSPKDGKNGRDGRDIDPEVIKATVVAMVADVAPTLISKAIGSQPTAPSPLDLDALTPLIKDAVAEVTKQWPVPKDGRDGRDVDMAAVELLVRTTVQKAIHDLPAPKDGTSVTVEDVAPLIKAAVSEAVTEPVGVQSALIDQAGELVISFTDGRMVKAGRARGEDVDPEWVSKQIVAAVDLIPRPKDGAPGKDGLDGKDGRDGVSFDDLTYEIDEARGVAVVKALSGEREHVVLEVPIMLFKGVYRAGDQYRAGNTVTCKGDLWIARSDTFETPGNGKTAWQLAVRRGRDGRDLRSKEDA
jgi:hypothetical protein